MANSLSDGARMGDAEKLDIIGEEYSIVSTIRVNSSPERGSLVFENNKDTTNLEYSFQSTGTTVVISWSCGGTKGMIENACITNLEYPIISIGNTVANSLSDGARTGDAEKLDITTEEYPIISS